MKNILIRIYLSPILQLYYMLLYLPPKISSNPKSQIGKNHLGLLFLKVPNPKPPEFHVLGDTTSTNLVIFTCHFPNSFHVVSFSVWNPGGLGLGLWDWDFAFWIWAASIVSSPTLGIRDKCTLSMHGLFPVPFI